MTLVEKNNVASGNFALDAPMIAESSDKQVAAPSILFRISSEKAESPKQPAYFSDLYLDLVIAAITSDWDEYTLQPFFFEPLREIDDVVFRQEVFLDLEDDDLCDEIHAFTAGMRTVREHLAHSNKVSYEGEKWAWFLAAVETYCDAVKRLTTALSTAALISRGFSAVSDYLDNYTHSSGFSSLFNEAIDLKRAIADIQFSILIKPDGFQVKKYEPARDLSAEVENTFARFRQGQVKDYKSEISVDSYMNHIEGKILEFVVEQNPNLFSRLSAYCSTNQNFINAAVGALDREIHFYLAYLRYICELESGGLAFCYPGIISQHGKIYARDAFDIALAHKLRDDIDRIVSNDFQLNGAERIIVVTGPNQGGKTTFARMFGQLHYLASLGCPVPGCEAQLFLFDAIFTHFEREETADTLRGKLQDDLVRVRDILDHATPSSIVILNEIFTSTTLQDAIYLSRLIMARLKELGLIAIWVTFVEELAAVDSSIVSMVSSVDPKDPDLRTFKMGRRAPYGLTHAMSIAEKYGVTYARLMERLHT